MKKRWWVRVFAYKTDGKLDKWPEGVQAWNSGYTPDDRTVWCLLMDCSHEDIPEILDKCWSEYSICFVHQKPDDWHPSDRFPDPKL